MQTLLSFTMGLMGYIKAVCTGRFTLPIIRMCMEGLLLRVRVCASLACFADLRGEWAYTYTIPNKCTLSPPGEKQITKSVYI